MSMMNYSLMQRLALRGMRFECVILEPALATSGAGAEMTYTASSEKIRCDFRPTILQKRLETMDVASVAKAKAEFVLPMYTGEGAKRKAIELRESQRIRLLESGIYKQQDFEIVTIQITDSATQDVIVSEVLS